MGEEGLHLLRAGGRSDIIIFGLDTPQDIPDAPPNEQGLMTGGP
jgi:hypothetical protein